MKFTERSNGLYLEDIRQRDIRFSNLAGRLTGSVYEDPSRPAHVLVLWLNDSLDIIDQLREYGIRIKDKQNEETGETTFSMQLKAYPRKVVNRRNGNEEFSPKVMIRTTENTVRLEPGSFGLVDSAHVESMDIRFHTWQWDERRPDVVAVIDELWLTVDEGAGEADQSYLDEKYGYDDGMLNALSYIVNKAKEKGMSDEEIRSKIAPVLEAYADELDDDAEDAPFN